MMATIFLAAGFLSGVTPVELPRRHASIDFMRPTPQTRDRVRCSLPPATGEE